MDTDKSNTGERDLTFFTAGHGLYDFCITQQMFDRSLFYNLLLQPRLTVPAFFFLQGGYVKAHLKERTTEDTWIETGLRRGYIESFNSKLRDELLNRELFLHIDELRYVADRWRMDYNHYRPHSSLDYMAPAAFAAKCLEQGSATLCLPQDKENRCDILSRQVDR